MKRFIVVLLMFGFVVPAFPDSSPLLDQVSVALLGHVETVVETTVRGKTNAELLMTPIEIGKCHGDYIVGLDGGVLGNIKPESAGQAGYDWTAGVHVHLSPLIHGFISKAFAVQYPALSSIEINPRVSYLFRNRANDVKPGWQFGFGIGWAFSLTAKQ